MTGSPQERGTGCRQAAWYAAAVAAGIVLRLLFPRDTVWQPDQMWAMSHALATGSTMPWSWLGMMSSSGIPNPGMSLWVFVFLVRCFHLTTPLLLSQGVAVMSIIALTLIGVWATTQMCGSEREEWLWAGALAAVNPVAVFLERVIWAQSLLPLFLVGFWFGFWNRRRWCGALLWGLLGACLVQIHLAGFFLLGGIVLTALISRGRREVHWLGFAVGLLLAGWPVIPWILNLASSHYERHQYAFGAHFPGKVWIWWLASDMGLGMKYLAASWDTPFVAFLKEPYLGGHATYGILLVHVALAGLLVPPFVWWLQRGIRKDQWKAAFLSGDSPNAVILRGCLFGFGGLLTLLPAPVFVHYFLTAFPIGFLCIARLWLCNGSNMQWARRGLCVIVILQLTLSLAAAFYIHKERPAAPGTFGLPLPTGWQKLMRHE